MNILVISDHFHKVSDQKDIQYVKWTDTNFPSALIGYQAILIDVTIEKIIQKERAPLLYKLKTELEDENLLKQNNLILVVVCGSPVTRLEFDIRDDEEFEEFDEENIPDMEKYYIQQFICYDFLAKVVPEYSSKLIFKRSSHIYSIAFIPVNYYLDICKGGSNFLYYDHLPGSKECIEVTPLAKMSPDREACIAFECRKGKGMAIILPSYRIDKKESAFSSLLRICRSYIKKAGVMREINNQVYDNQPDSVKEAYLEALTCFNYDLYTAALMMCRRSLEASIVEEQGENNKITFLGKRIKQLHENGIISSDLKNIATYIKDFGDWSAHPAKYRGNKVTGIDAAMIIDFLEAYLLYFHQFKEKLQNFENRKDALKEKEGK